MPFIPLEISNGPARPSIFASLKKMGAKPAKTTLYLAADASAKFGIVAGDQVEVMLGTEEQHGILRIRKGNGPVIKPAGPKGDLALSLGHIDSFVDRQERKAACTVELVDDWAEIVLPKWADETAPRRVIVAPARPLLKAPATTHRRRPTTGLWVGNVTAASQGDPPRSRSALVIGAAERAEMRAQLRTAESEIRRDSEAEARQELRARREASGAKSGPGTNLSKSQRGLLAALAKGHVVDKPGVLAASNSTSPDIRMARVLIGYLRAKCEGTGLVIKTVRGDGYVLDEVSCEIAGNILAAYA